MQIHSVHIIGYFPLFFFSYYPHIFKTQYFFIPSVTSVMLCVGMMKHELAYTSLPLPPPPLPSCWLSVRVCPAVCLSLLYFYEKFLDE